LIAVWAREVVAPPISSGNVETLRCISLGDMAHLLERRRDQAGQADGTVAPCSRAAARIFSHGTITPRSITS
jgi:hypothetical protein